MSNIIYKRAETEEELMQILNLQELNIRDKDSTKDVENEGFVTIKHDLDLLRRMNQKAPHIIAKYHGNVIGYALVMLQEFKEEIPLLRPMFLKINERIDHSSYFAMGQVCIDKNYRKQGIFRGLYNFMKTELQDKFRMTITEVNKANARSMAAHYAVGFKALENNNPQEQDWELIYWDWS